MLMNFDAPDSNVACTPPPPFQHAAAGAEPAQRSGLLRSRAGPGAPRPDAKPQPDERLDYAFELSLGRAPARTRARTRPTSARPAGDRPGQERQDQASELLPLRPQDAAWVSAWRASCSTSTSSSPGSRRHERTRFPRTAQPPRASSAKSAGGIGTMAPGDLLERDGRRAASEPARAQAAALPRARPRTSSSCSWKAARARWISSTPSPELQKMHGQTLPESLTKQTAARLHQAERRGAGQPARVQAARPERHRALRLHPQHRLLRRRHLPGPLDVHRGLQPSPRPVAAVHRHACSSAGPPWARGPLYGLGSEVAEPARLRRAAAPASAPAAAPSNFSSGFLPSTYQGTLFRSSGRSDPLSLEPRRASRHETQRARLDAVRDLNQERLDDDRRLGDRLAHRLLRTRLPHADGRAGAARLLARSPSDAARCTASTRSRRKQFGTNCLLARRMVERGVRFVLLMHASLGPAHQPQQGPQEELRHRPTSRPPR